MKFVLFVRAGVTIMHVRQGNAKGLGHAVLYDEQLLARLLPLFYLMYYLLNLIVIKKQKILLQC